MDQRIKILSFVMGLFFFGFVLSFVKRNAMRSGYVVLWFTVCFFLISIPLFDNVYRWIAYSVVGIIDARHIIYIALISFLLIYSFYVTLKISQMSDQIQELISSLAILENQVNSNSNSQAISKKKNENAQA